MKCADIVVRDLLYVINTPISVLVSSRSMMLWHHYYTTLSMCVRFPRSWWKLIHGYWTCNEAKTLASDRTCWRKAAVQCAL